MSSVRISKIGSNLLGFSHRIFPSLRVAGHNGVAGSLCLGCLGRVGYVTLSPQVAHVTASPLPLPTSWRTERPRRRFGRICAYSGFSLGLRWGVSLLGRRPIRLLEGPDLLVVRFDRTSRLCATLCRLLSNLLLLCFCPIFLVRIVAGCEELDAVAFRQPIELNTITSGQLSKLSTAVF
jgi:hypothetical protein